MKVLSPDGGAWGNLEVSRGQMADQEKSLLASLNMMIAHAAGLENTSKTQMLMLREAMKKNKVTCEEAIEAFWAAYSDPYVSQGRIEWRHMWKHIEKMRKGEEGRYFTYEQMLGKMHKDSIPQSVFTMVPEEKDAQGRPMWALK